jgi:hypothetical protein
MKSFLKFVLAVAVGVAALTAADAPKKNWTPPAYKIYAQTLSDQIMAQHPELISVTFHGVPPGLKDVYTMFAGSFPERIGNPDDDDDVMVCKLGITIIDPRWNRPKDPVKKFVMMMSLRDAAGQHCGLLVLAYKNDGANAKGERGFFTAASDLRDALQKQIPSYAALFEKAK